MAKTSPKIPYTLHITQYKRDTITANKEINIRNTAVFATIIESAFSSKSKEIKNIPIHIYIRAKGSFYW